MKVSEYDRVDNDYYVEPSWSVHDLIDREEFSNECWDPSCGSGTIPRAFMQRDIVCHGSDLIDRGYGDGGVDFFESKRKVCNIVSNSPFSVIENYVLHALTLASHKVVMLARLNLLESQKRKDFFANTPLARVWVSRRRISMPPGGSNIKASGGRHAYAWFVWDHAHDQGYYPTIGWF